MNTAGKPKVYASDLTYAAIMAYGQNTKKKWWHPLSSGQYYSYRNSKVGDKVPFIMNGLHNSDVEIVSLSNNNEFRKLKDLYGDIKFPPTVTWNFEYMVLVKKTH